MNALADPFKQLVERRLWPVAVLLVAALVAVPMLLGKSGDRPVVPSPVAAVPAGQGDTESVVGETDPARTDAVRAVLGDRKDPFRPAVIHRAPKPVTAVSNNSALATKVTPDPGSGGSSGGGTTTAPVAAPEPVATATPAPKRTYELYSLQVRFGDTSGELATRTVKRLSGLPGGVHPAVLYLGLADDHKSAVFIVDAGVETVGDGHCDPAPDNCQTLTLEPGETEFLTRGDKQWELDLIRIHTKRTTDAKAAAKARSTIASGGRQVLRGLVSRVGSWRYDTGRGTLRKLAKAKPARATRVAAFRSSG